MRLYLPASGNVNSNFPARTRDSYSQPERDSNSHADPNIELHVRLMCH